MITRDLKNKVNAAKDDKLLDLLNKENHGSPKWNFIFDEFKRRQLQKIGKTHWSQYMVNIACIIGAIAAVAAAYLSWIQVKSLLSP